MSDELTELPEGWKWTSIEAIAIYVQRGKSPKYVERSELPVINQRSIRWHGIELEYLKFIHPEQWSQWSEERFLQIGDILWNSTGTGTIGRATIYSGLTGYSKAVADSHVTVIRTHGHNAKLLHFWIIALISLMWYSQHSFARCAYHPNETLFPRLASESYRDV